MILVKQLYCTHSGIRARGFWDKNTSQYSISCEDLSSHPMTLDVTVGVRTSWPSSTITPLLLSEGPEDRLLDVFTVATHLLYCTEAVTSDTRGKESQLRVISPGYQKRARVQVSERIAIFFLYCSFHMARHSPSLSSVIAHA